VIHHAIIGELACGSVKQRQKFLSSLKSLPLCAEVAPGEVLELIERRHLRGKGLSWVDCQLLASAAIFELKIFTADCNLKAAARSLKLL